MDSSGQKINWEDEASHVLLNPRSPESENRELVELTRIFPQQAHVWIASSGSSKSAHQSVKFIALSKSAFLSAARAANQHLQSTSQDCWIRVLPTFHVGGRSIETRSFLSGARVLEGFHDGKWDPQYFHKLAIQEKATLSALVPTQVVDLIQAGLRAPTSMRAIVIGGSALSLEIYAKALDLGWPLLPSYGMTECCSQVATASLASLQTRKPELEFLPHIHAETTAEGFLRVQSPSLLTGFAQWKDGKPHWVDPKVDGWYQTEDLCEIVGSVLTPLGRGSDFVKILGEGVSLQKLQEILESLALQRIPQVWNQVALVALPDERAQFQICLALTSSVGDVQKLIEDFNSRVAPYERIKSSRIVSSIPRTALGKIARGTLREICS